MKSERKHTLFDKKFKMLVGTIDKCFKDDYLFIGGLAVQAYSLLLEQESPDGTNLDKFEEYDKNNLRKISDIDVIAGYSTRKALTEYFDRLCIKYTQDLLNEAGDDHIYIFLDEKEYTVHPLRARPKNEFFVSSISNGKKISIIGDGGIMIRLPRLEDLIVMKKKTFRKKDDEDIELLCKKLLRLKKKKRRLFLDADYLTDRLLLAKLNPLFDNPFNK